MTGILQDLRYALRLLSRSRGFAAVAILTLALGIGLNTSIFSLVEAAMLRMLPVDRPEQLYGVQKIGPGQEEGDFSQPLYEHMRRAVPDRARLLAYSSVSRSYLTLHGGQPKTLWVQLVSPEYFDVLGVRPEWGGFSALSSRTLQEDQPAILAYGFWQREFGGDRAVIGRRVKINSAWVDIAGIAPRGFFGIGNSQSPDVWLPLAAQSPVRFAGNARSRGGAHSSRPWGAQEDIYWLSVVARVPSPSRIPNVTAALDMQVRLDNVRQTVGESDPVRRQRLLSLKTVLDTAGRIPEGLRESLERPLFVLMGAAALVLMITCANVANLLFTRGQERRREIAIRMAVGGTRRRVVRQLLMESLVLSTAGAAAGLFFALWSKDALLGWLGGDSRSIALAPELNPWVLAFAAGISILVALFFGLLPALVATQIELASAAKADAGAAARGRFHSSLLTRGIVAAQISLSFVLLAGAGLLERSLRNLAAAELGFEKHSVLSIAIDPQAAGYSEARFAELQPRLVDAARATPGVVTASMSLFSPGSGPIASGAIYVVGVEPRPGEERSVADNIVGPGYFATLGVPVLAGREFQERDSRNSPPVAIVNESFVKRFFGRGNPLGRRISYSPGHRGFEIVGVVKDMNFRSARRPLAPMVYHPSSQQSDFLGSIEVRVRGDADAMIVPLRRAIQQVDASLPVLTVQTLQQQMDRLLIQERTIARLTGAFSLLAVLLAAIGLYGLISYRVARRTRELGIRMAVGADAGSILRMLLIEAMALTLAGIAVGIPCALGSARLLKALLYGLSPNDPLTLAAACAALAIAAIAASAIPARRATRIDPIQALRCE